jgi:rfaE bifunctional protein nucleotidyltransferase chain/domain
MIPSMNLRDKILSWDRLTSWRDGLRNRNQRLVVTNGCFDLLHAGHVTYLEAARNQGDALLVGLNSDASVRELKGPNRPVNSQEDRALVIAALASVDAVCIFAELRAVRLLETVQPDIYVKGGDFTVDQLPAEERAVVERFGGRILTLGLVPGRSTTGLLERLAAR